MGIQLIFIITALIVIIGEDLRRQDELPVGVIWIVSTFIYGGLGIIFDMMTLWRQSDIDPIDLAIDQLGFNVFTIALIGFVAGYYVIKRFLRSSRLRETMSISSLVRQASEFNYYSLLVQVLIVFYSLALILFDLPDRYNSYPGSTTIGKLINSLSLITLLGPAAFFSLGWQVRAFSRLPNRSIIVLTGCAAGLNLILVFKTGSRSILLGVLLAFFIGWIANNASRRAFIQAFVSLALVIVMFVPFSEALRIARSDSDFYRANPLYAIDLVQKSMLRRPELDRLYQQLERHPLDRAAYKSVIECQHALSRVEINSNVGQDSVPFTSVADDICKRDSQGYISIKYWPSLSQVLSGLKRADSSVLFPSKPYLSDLQVELYGTTNVSSPGEAPSLRADTFYRFGYVGVFSIYLCVGILYGGYNCAIFLFLRNASIYARLNAALLPLTLLTGNLSLGLLTCFWLYLIQLPKNIFVVSVFGFLIGFCIKTHSPTEDSFDA